jgi:hypothetical protein
LFVLSKGTCMQSHLDAFVFPSLPLSLPPLRTVSAPPFVLYFNSATASLNPILSIKEDQQQHHRGVLT